MNTHVTQLTPLLKKIKWHGVKRRETKRGEIGRGVAKHQRYPFLLLSDSLLSYLNNAPTDTYSSQCTPPVQSRIYLVRCYLRAVSVIPNQMEYTGNLCTVSARLPLITNSNHSYFMFSCPFSCFNCAHFTDIFDIQPTN